MQAEIKENVKNWEDDDEVAAYLAKIVNTQAILSFLEIRLLLKL